MGRIGILLDKGYDLSMERGRLVVGGTLYQDLAVICECYPGELRGDPTLGVGIGGYVCDGVSAELGHSIRDNGRRDGILVRGISVGADGCITVSAEEYV